MSISLRVLILEDDLMDADLMVLKLKSAGFDPNWNRVETEAEFRNALNSQLDVILSDYTLPQFDAPGALDLLKASGIDVPFIVVTGSITDTMAVQCMKQGASDYLLKDRLERLGQAVTRALEERELRKAKRVADCALEESEQKYRTLVTRMPAMVIEHEPGGKLLFLNEAVTRTLGYEGHELIGRNVRELFSRHQVQFDSRGLEPGLIRSEAPEGQELVMTAKDGSQKTVFWNRSTLFDNDGKPERVIWSGIDITERKLVEDHLRRAKQQYENLVESISDIVFSLDLEGRITYINRAIEQTHGFAPGDVVGKFFKDFICHQDLDSLLAENESSVLDETRVVECCSVSKSGETRFLQCLTRWQVESGQVVGITGVARDVTEQHRAEQALTRIYDMATRYHGNELFSQAAGTLAQLLGIAHVFVGELVDGGRRIEPLVSVSHGEPGPGRRFELEGTPWQLVIELRRVCEYAERVTELFPAATDLAEMGVESFIGAPITATSGEIIGIIVACDDRPRQYTDAEARILEIVGQRVGTEIIRLRQNEAQIMLERQLFQSQKMEAIGRLAGGIAHDFNNLLTAINGFSELLLRRMEDRHPFRTGMEEIRKAGLRAAALTRQLLAFSRKQTLEPKVIDLNIVLTEMDRMLRRLIGEDINLVTKPAAGWGHVKADQGQLEQVMMNLVVNARDAMPCGGTLTIETANIEIDESHNTIPPHKYVVLMVSDTGCGMDAETRSKVFEPFFTTKEFGKGTGLGLATVHGIVRQSGGEIVIDSQPGRGTTFKLYLPPAEQEAEPCRPEVSPAFRRGRETILLVEDEEVVRMIAREILEMNGYNVLEARNGPEAMRLCEKNTAPIHLMVTDVVMPEMSGRELAERLSTSHPEMNVLFMSGYCDDEIVQYGVLGGRTAFIEKPFTPDPFIRTVREVLGSSTVKAAGKS